MIILRNFWPLGLLVGVKYNYESAFLNTGMKIFLKIRGNIRGIFKEKRGNNIQFASNTGRKIKIGNVHQHDFFGSVKNILILTENESKYGGTVIITR